FAVTLTSAPRWPFANSAGQAVALHPVAATGLGPVKRLVGAVDQRREVGVTPAPRGHADAGRDLQPGGDVVQVDRLHRKPQAFGNLRGRRHRRARQYSDELLAPETPQPVALAQRALAGSRNAAQHLVASEMAVHVV